MAINIEIEIPVDILWCVLYTAKYPQEFHVRMESVVHNLLSWISICMIIILE